MAGVICGRTAAAAGVASLIQLTTTDHRISRRSSRTPVPPDGFPRLPRLRSSAGLYTAAAGPTQTLNRSRRKFRPSDLAGGSLRPSDSSPKKSKPRLRPAAVLRETVGLESDSTSFPAFLPEKVEELIEPAARQLAARIQRLPVQTRFADDPVMTSCVVPPNSGSQNLPILLLHSFDGSLLEWRRLYPLLEAAGEEVWMLDTLGWGFSDTEKGVRSFSAEAKRDHLYEFWKKYIRRPVLVVGPSLGGAAALDFAVTHPDAVSKLALIDAQGFTEGVGNMSTLPKILAYAGVAVLKSNALRTYATKQCFFDPVLATDDSMRVGGLHTHMPGWADAMVGFMESGGYNVASKIPQVAQEAIVIWGENDKILDKSLAQQFEAALPKSRVEIIPSCGHLPHVEAPAQVANILNDWLKG